MGWTWLLLSGGCAATRKEPIMEILSRLLSATISASITVCRMRPADHVIDGLDTFEGSPHPLEVHPCPNPLAIHQPQNPSRARELLRAKSGSNGWPASRPPA